MTVVEDAPATAVIGPSGVHELEARSVGLEELLTLIHEPPPQPLLLLLHGAIDDLTAARLQDARIGFVDVVGHLWLPGLEVTPMKRTTKAIGPRALRPESLRLAQLLADHPGRPWTERALAKRGDSTQVTAHRLLSRLEDEELVERRGRGGADAGRRIADVRRFREWLAEHGRPSRVARLDCFVRDPLQIHGPPDGPSFVLTGAVAARLSGRPVVTGEPRPLYRVDCTAARLEDLPALIGGFRTEQGANATLVADPGRLAHTDARRLADGRLLAPPSRIMLDLYLDARGTATAEVFRDLWTDGGA